MVICHLCIMKCLKIPKRIIRSCELNDRHYNTMAKRKRRKELTKTYKTLEKIYGDQFKDSKGIIKIRKSKDRQYNGQKKKDTFWYLQTFHYTKMANYHTSSHVNIFLWIRYTFVYHLAIYYILLLT
jgi:hypothetical protein